MAFDSTNTTTTNTTTNNNTGADSQAEFEFTPAPVYRGGPRTTAGKARSRFNATKHGLRATLLLVEQNQAVLSHILQRFEQELQPQDTAERLFVDRAARAAVRVEIAVQIQNDATEQRARAASRDWTKKQRQRVRRLGQNLKYSPADTLARLEESAYGIEWLIHQWEALQADLDAGLAWEPEQFDRAMLLLGVDPSEAPANLVEEPLAAAIWELAQTAHNAPEARNRLPGLLSSILQDLETMASEAYREVDKPELDKAVRRALIDDSPEGVRLQRYERDAENAVHRNIAAVYKHRKNRVEDRINLPTRRTQAPTPTPTPTPAPPPMIDPRPLAVAVADITAAAPNELSDAFEPIDLDNPRPFTMEDLRRITAKVNREAQQRTEASFEGSVEVPSSDFDEPLEDEEELEEEYEAAEVFSVLV